MSSRSDGRWENGWENRTMTEPGLPWDAASFILKPGEDLHLAEQAVRRRFGAGEERE